MTDLKPEDLVKLREIAEMRARITDEHAASGRSTTAKEFASAFTPDVCLSLLADRARMEKALRDLIECDDDARNPLQNGIGLIDCIDNVGQFYPSQHLDNCLKAARQALGASRLSEQNRALIERHLPSLFMDARHTMTRRPEVDELARLLDAARAEGVAALQQAAKRASKADAERLHYAGVRASIAWLHDHAETMNDPHAKAVINTAALGLGVNKPSPLPQQTALVEEGVEKIMAQHEPAACGEGTLPSPSDPPRQGWENWAAQKISTAWYDGFVNAKKNDDWEDMYDWAALTGQAYAMEVVEHRNPPPADGEEG